MSPAPRTRREAAAMSGSSGCGKGPRRNWSFSYPKPPRSHTDQRRGLSTSRRGAGLWRQRRRLENPASNHRVPEQRDTAGGSSLRPAGNKPGRRRCSTSRSGFVSGRRKQVRGKHLTRNWYGPAGCQSRSAPGRISEPVVTLGTPWKVLYTSQSALTLSTCFKSDARSSFRQRSFQSDSIYKLP